MIMWENESPKGFKGQNWIQSIVPLISLYFEFFNEIGNIEMVGYLKMNDNVRKCVARGF